MGKRKEPGRWNGGNLRQPRKVGEQSRVGAHAAGNRVASNSMKFPVVPASLALIFTVSLAVAAEPFLSPVFTDNMVLQRDQEDAVWGWADPGAKVTVSLAGQTADAVAGADGKWKLLLPALPAGGPHTMTVSGPEQVTLENILIGDVWICSGQSNMEWGVGSSNNAGQEIAAATDGQIRLLTVSKGVAPEPEATFESNGWQVCSPETVGGFSAVGYFFGRALREDLEVPIGLIHTSWGGTIAEAWTSKEALQPLGDFNQAMEELERQAKAGAADPRTEWFAKHDPGSAGGRAPWAAVDLDDSGWTAMNQPQEWSASGVDELGRLDGAVWFRRAFDVAAVGKAGRLHLGSIDDDDSVWLNGEPVGSSEGHQKQRVYEIPAGLLKAGENTLAVRVFDSFGGGGFTGPAEQMKIEMEGVAPVPLSGEWRYRIGADLSKAPPYPKPLGNNPNVPTVLYNAMISPLLPYGIKGAIWYQGESNAGRAAQYRKLLPAMIGDWRARFGQGDFPFYIVQLANFTPRAAEPGDSDWAELREAQALTAKNVPNCGLAVTIDIGEADDIHPRNKQDVGKRLALAALGQAYGKDIVHSGPGFKSVVFQDGVATIAFDHVGGGLVAAPPGLKGFAIAGEDKKFVWADARIEGDSVVVSAPQVGSPVAVRYAWAHNPEATLFNREGLPARPFRTDDWPGVTEGRK